MAIVYCGIGLVVMINEVVEAMIPWIFYFAMFS